MLIYIANKIYRGNSHFMLYQLLQISNEIIRIYNSSTAWSLKQFSAVIFNPPNYYKSNESYDKKQVRQDIWAIRQAVHIDKKELRTKYRALRRNPVKNFDH